MEIPEKGSVPSLPAADRSGEAWPPASIEPTEVRPKTAPSDTVSLTERGREYKAAVQSAQSLPVIREDRIMRLKRQLEAGTYQVIGERTAANMIHETIENNRVWKHVDAKM